MARSRNIKPGFFQNEQLVELDFGARLLFIGLWTIADREGRLESRPKKIKMQLFPADDLDVSRALLGLAKYNLVTLYSVENVDYIEINNFLKHQHPHHKETESVIPKCVSPRQALDKSGSNPSDSLLPITDSLNPETESLNPKTDTPTPKKERKPKKEIKPRENIEGLNIEAFDKYLAYRKEAGIKKLTKQGETLSAKKLVKLGGNKQIEVVEQSIGNGWAGLFELKATSSSQKQSRIDEFNEWIDSDNNFINGECNVIK